MEKRVFALACLVLSLALCTWAQRAPSRSRSSSSAAPARSAAPSAVLEAFVKRHGQGFADSDAFANGVMASPIMRKDTTPDEEHITALLEYEPAGGDQRHEALWNRIFRESATKALDKHYPAIKKKARLGEIFRFQSLAELAG